MATLLVAIHGTAIMQIWLQEFVGGPSGRVSKKGKHVHVLEAA
jgi:hypothetical protein